MADQTATIRWAGGVLLTLLLATVPVEAWSGAAPAANHTVTIGSGEGLTVPEVPAEDDAEDDAADHNIEFGGAATKDGLREIDSVLAKPQIEKRGLGSPGVEGSDAYADGTRAERRRTGFLYDQRGDIIQVGSALAIVIGLLLAFRFLFLRLGGAMVGGGRPSGVIETLARYPIARGQSLTLFKLGRRIVLVHQAGSSMTTLTELTDRDEVASLLTRIEAGSSGRDAARFKTLLNDYRLEHERMSRQGEDAGEPTFNDTMGAVDEVVDLTRCQIGGLRGLFSRRSKAQ